MEITKTQAFALMDKICENYVGILSQILPNLGVDVEEFLTLNIPQLEEVTRISFDNYCEILGIGTVKDE